jgi:DNA-directed RNA polymerase I, II, and III subunit RPABC1
MATGRKSMDDISRVYHVMITVGEMCADRGYRVPPQWCPPTLEQFSAKFAPDNIINRDAMTLVCDKGELEHSELVVFFNGEPAVTTQSVKRHADQAVRENMRQAILVVAGKLNAITKKYVDSLGRGGENALSMQVFDEDTLVVNITRHDLVPKHEPLSAEEAKSVLAAFSLQASQLPRILSRDPISEYFGMQKGQLFRITRKSETAGEYTTYRQVV